ncbi:ATP-binding cassette domain-containing protein [Brevibacterium luteolum]|uniref:ATP-binding cassette domain-containing protein n=1 Tax=Brevibacterium luteolum TaxID=199591 RepID=UPI001C22099B|nr:ATP-binding cassette domain-containing protein [Brevibacterium luteolum]MBU8577375.1 ATP-binding cassette domain-containing protein [Brevibacterium luteolum]
MHASSLFLPGLRRSGIAELVALLVGADSLTDRRMLIDGVDIRLNGVVDALRHGIGYLSDRDDEIGIGETATLGGALTSIQGADAAGSGSVIEDMRRLQKVVRTIESLGIRAATLDQEVEDLSGGDQQKIALARWLRSGCRILVLNHPTRGIDAAARKAIYELSDELLATGTAVVLVSSDVSELLAHSHRIAVMRQHEIFDVYQNENVTEDIVMQIALGAADEQKAQV